MRRNSLERDNLARLRTTARVYAVRRLRPFCRRRLITARPARVLIRLRKPCFLARLRVLG